MLVTLLLKKVPKWRSMTEWDEFTKYDYQSIYDSMIKPAFLIDGRNILDLNQLKSIGYQASGIGKGSE